MPKCGMEIKKMDGVFFSSGGEAPTQKINMDFKKTCKILFGQEIGELSEFAPYLSEMMFPSTKAVSSLSSNCFVSS